MGVYLLSRFFSQIFFIGRFFKKTFLTPPESPSCLALPRRQARGKSHYGRERLVSGRLTRTQWMLCLLLIFLLTTGQGCAIQFKKKKQQELPVSLDGGLYRSLDGGQTWQQVPDVLSIPGGVKINTLDVKDIVFDPLDKNTFYLLGRDGAVYYSTDRAGSWLPLKGVASGINDLAIDPRNSCTVYLVTGNRVMKTVNCLRTWTEIFHTDPSGKSLVSIAVDLRSSNILYASTSSEIYKSIDRGRSWQSNTNISGGIRDMKLRNVGTTEFIYVLTESNFIYQSRNQGKDWEHMGPAFKKYRKAAQLVDFLFDDSGRNTLIHISPVGILRSSDGGESFEKVTILSGNAAIRSVAVSPRNRNLIFYTTDTTWYRSEDNGANWITGELPLDRRYAKKVIIDRDDPRLMYLISFQEPPPPEEKVQPGVFF